MSEYTVNTGSKIYSYDTIEQGVACYVDFLDYDSPYVSVSHRFLIQLNSQFGSEQVAAQLDKHFAENKLANKTA